MPTPTWALRLSASLVYGTAACLALLAILKLMGAIGWPWWLLLTPLWVLLTLMATVPAAVILLTVARHAAARRGKP